jgi:hypothetical protein
VVALNNERAKEYVLLGTPTLVSSNITSIDINSRSDAIVIFDEVNMIAELGLIETGGKK